MNPKYILGKLRKGSCSWSRKEDREKFRDGSIHLFTQSSSVEWVYTVSGNIHGVNGKWWFHISFIKKIEIDEYGQQFLEGMFE